MIQADDENSMASTKRCLFPETQDNVSLETELMLHGEESRHCDPPVEDLLYRERRSPTSVSGYPVVSLTEKSTITMCEDGAEVTLDLSSLFLTTPDKTSGKSRPMGQVPSNSLLDVDATPTPPTTKTKNRTNSKNIGTCCANQGYQEDEYQVGPNLEKTITSFLEEDEHCAGCSGWQTWLFMMDSTAVLIPSKENIRSNLRNRAFNLGARKTRVRQLRRDLNPFISSPGRKSQSDDHLLKCNSFSISEHANAIARVSKDKKTNRSISLKDVFQSCTMPENATLESPTFSRSHARVSEDEVCYDSDPEDFARRRDTQKLSAELDKENQRDYNKFSYPRSIAVSPSGKIDAMNDDAFYSVVQEFFNVSSTLIYHPSNSFDPCAIRSSSSIGVPVHAWLERGQRLVEVIQPKWMWKPKSRSGKNEWMVAIRGIELLDITRILPLDQIDRSRHPFAKAQHCFVLKTIDGEDLMFECKSVAERKRLLYSLKMVIARFGAKVLMGDDSLYKEFFATMEVGIPGKAPKITCVGTQRKAAYL